jgi:uncharacterized membrane protein YkvA (DUF1232 family)
MNDRPSSKQKRKLNPERVRSSASYRSALASSAKFLKKPEKLAKLLDDAANKIRKLDSGPIAEVKDNLYSLFRLVKRYSKGEYRDISWANLVLVVSAIVYFVTPLDMLPDFLLAMGYLDDAAILGWTVKTLGDELSKFNAWEREHNQAPAEVDLADD